MNNRYANENANEPDDMPMPRTLYPNDVLPDENAITRMSRRAQAAVVKTDSSNPR